MTTIHNTIKGEYQFTVLRPDGSVRASTPWFKNLITNSGLDMLGNSVAMGYYAKCRVGTGNTAPAFTDTLLVAQVMDSSSLAAEPPTSTGSPNYTRTVVRKYTFPAAATNYNLAEVGIGQTASSTLFSRALLLDGGGAPTTFTVLMGEILIVLYRQSLYESITDATQALTIGGVSTTVTVRRGSASAPLTGLGFSSGYSVSAAACTGGLGSITGQPTGYNGSSQHTASFAAYTAGNHYIDLTATFTPSNMTVPIRSVLISQSTNLEYQIGFSPDIAKSNTNQFVLKVRFSWARH